MLTIVEILLKLEVANKVWVAYVASCQPMSARL